MLRLNVLLFSGFETLDVFGPVEVFGMANKIKQNEFEIEFFSEKGGLISSSQNARIETLPISEIKDGGILFIPGGWGVRSEIDNLIFLDEIKTLAQKAEYILTVCTGSALLAKTGLLKSRRATSNKISFDWVSQQDQEVEWVRKARWVKDGRFYTSSGVSAGIDMSLGFVADCLGEIIAKNTAKSMEYVWNKDKDNDPFC
jgi:transcriptional regulator GlxA family with amidase domain